MAEGELLARLAVAARRADACDAGEQPRPLTREAKVAHSQERVVDAEARFAAQMPQAQPLAILGESSASGFAGPAGSGGGASSVSARSLGQPMTLAMLGELGAEVDTAQPGVGSSISLSSGNGSFSLFLGGLSLGSILSMMGLSLFSLSSFFFLGSLSLRGGSRGSGLLSLGLLNLLFSSLLLYLFNSFLLFGSFSLLLGSGGFILGSLSYCGLSFSNRVSSLLWASLSRICGSWCSFGGISSSLSFNLLISFGFLGGMLLGFWLLFFTCLF